MLRYIYTLCELLSAVCAIISPVAIFHWLLRIINFQGVASLVNMLNPVFDPLNAIVEFVVKAPPLSYGGHQYSTTQGVLACVMTGAFFLFNFVAESLKASEQRMEVSRQAEQQRKRLQKLRDDQSKKQKFVTTNRRIYLVLDYDFQACPEGGAQWESTYARYHGKVLASYHNSLALEFDSIEQVVSYCMGAAQGILGHYATLRPLDPQPPFKVGIQSLDAEISTGAGVTATRKLISYVGPNQVIFSQEIRAMLESQGIDKAYRYQSIGMYAMEGGYQQELYRLYFTKPSASF